MGAAFGWGLVAGSSLVLGGWLALRFSIRSRTLGLVMAFGAGVLISAVAYELVGEAVATAERARAVALGLFAGALVFHVGDAWIARIGGADRKSSRGKQAGGSSLAIVLGTVLDGIPESAVIGLGLLDGKGVSVAVLAAVFLSNLPEAIAATTGLSAAGWSRRRVFELWLVVGIVCALAAVAGYAFFDGAPPDVLAFVLAFAGGAVLTMLANTMMPEAFEHSGRLVGLLTTLGFAVAFGISSLQ